MADDILGHDHLEHGKHLHKGKHAHGDHGHARPKVKHMPYKPSYTHLRVEGSPKHIGLREKKRKGRDAHGHDTHNAHNANHNSHDDHAHTQSKYSWLRWVIGLAIALPIAFYLFANHFVIAFMIILVAVNCVLQYYKQFLEGAPIDFELLSAGTAYLAATEGLLPAIALIVVGVYSGDLVHGHISGLSWVKQLSLLIVAIAAPLVGSTPTGLFVAVVFGLVTQFALMQMVGTTDAVSNAIRRITNGAVNGYVLFFVLPWILRLNG